MPKSHSDKFGNFHVDQLIDFIAGQNGKRKGSVSGVTSESFRAIPVNVFDRRNPLTVVVDSSLLLIAFHQSPFVT